MRCLCECSGRGLPAGCGAAGRLASGPVGAAGGWLGGSGLVDCPRPALAPPSAGRGAGRDHG
jgi:hypothetical protein